MTTWFPACDRRVRPQSMSIAKKLIPRRLHPVAHRLRDTLIWLRYGGDRDRAKRGQELAYWHRAQRIDPTLDNAHYQRCFTTAFGLDRAHFTAKRMLDVGCGPRGTLEWASDAAERVGLDPLIADYQDLGIEKHAMRYVCAPAETIPFDDGHFDVVSSFNSLDHVDDLDRSISSLIRVTRAGGDILLIVETGHRPRITEPISLSWDVLDKFKPACDVIVERRLQNLDGGIYTSIERALPFDADSDDEGVLVARLRRC